MKRLVIRCLDLRARARVFFAEIRHDSAVRTLGWAMTELRRAQESEVVFKGELSAVQREAYLAAQQVRRYDQRAAVGLR